MSTAAEPMISSESTDGDLENTVLYSVTIQGCDVLRLDVLNTANLCPAVFVVGLFYLLTVMYTFVWFGTLVHFRWTVHSKL